MKKTGLGLVALGIALAIAFIALQQPPAPPSGATPTTSYTVTTTSQSPTSTAEKPTETKTQTTETETPTTTTSTAQPPRRVAYTPSIEVGIETPGVVNTTKLPIYINYTIVIRNLGNGTGVAVVGGVSYEVAPHQEVRIAANKTVGWAGEHVVEAVVNGTRYAKTVKVYYYAPRLQAEPVYINVTKLPANITVTVRVSNLGNLTAWVRGVAVAPGETKTINTTITVEAAGSYAVEIDGVEVPVAVRYYTVGFEWRVGGPSEVEALPGETYAAWLWIKNTGNATARLSIDGRAVTLAPGEELNLTKTVTIKTAGVYTAEFKIIGDLNATLRHVIEAKVVAPKVELVIWNPEIRRSWPPPNATDRTSIDATSKTVTLSWGYIITTNATKRSITLVVEGPATAERYVLKPGEHVARNFTETVEAPQEKTIEIKVNSTSYRLVLALALAPPKITVREISRIEFTDARRLSGIRVSCRGLPETTIDVIWVRGTVTYTPTGRSASGQIRVKTEIGEYTGEYRGNIEGNRGSLSVYMAGHSIEVEFTTSPLAMTRVSIDGTPYSCNDLTGLAPPIFHRETPTATDEPVTQYAFRLLSAFAKTDSDRPQSIRWNGEYVEAVDRGGGTYQIYFREREIEIRGPLTATLVISQ